MRRGLIFLLLMFFSVGLFCGCAGDEAKPPISDIRQLNAPEYIVGVPQGTAAMAEMEAMFPQATIKYYNLPEDGYLAVRQGKIDAYAYDRSFMTLACANMDDVALMADELGSVGIVIGISPQWPELKAQIDAFIAQLKADGTLDDMYRRWVVRGQTEMPVIEPPAAPEMVLSIATSGTVPMMTYYNENQELTGHDIELIRRLARYLNAEVELAVAGFDGMIAGCGSGVYDCVISNLNATPERAEAIIFSEPYLISHTALMVKKDRLAAPSVVAITSLDQLAGQPVGILTGSVFDTILLEQCPEAIPVYYGSYSDCLLALEAGKIPAFVASEPSVLEMMYNFTNLTYLSPPLTQISYAYVFPKNNAALRDQFSAVLAELEREGFLEEMKAKWFSANMELKSLPELELTGENGTLVMATAANISPFTYISEGQNMGYDIEVAQHICQRLGYGLTIESMEPIAILPGVNTGKYHFGGSGITDTEERRQAVLFSAPNGWAGVVVATLKQDAPAAASAYTAEGLATGRVALMTGSTAEEFIRENYPGAQIFSFENINDALPALQSQKVDYIMTAYTTAMNFIRHQPGLTMLEEKVFDEPIRIAVTKDNEALLDEIDRVLTQFKQDGTLAEVIGHWIREDNSAYELADIPAHTEGPVLKVAIAANREPMCFVMDGDYEGVDCELIERIAYELGMRVEYSDMNFSALITALTSGKNDVIISNIAMTPERAESINFTQSYFENPQVLVVRQAGWIDGAAAATGFGEGIKKSFVKNFITEDRWKLIRDGLYVTIIISLGAALLGTILGFGVCMLRRSPKKAFNIPAKVFIRLIQGIPIVVFLMILYYVVFGASGINAIYVAILGFAINFAAYVSEMMRTGIDAVDEGQLEAAAALGFNPLRTFGLITMPQAAQHFLPVFKGEFISMVKMTSVVGYIAIQDLTKMSDIIRSRTYEAFFPLITTALIYFIISYALITILTLIELKIDPKTKKRRLKGVKI